MEQDWRLRITAQFVTFLATFINAHNAVLKNSRHAQSAQPLWSTRMRTSSHTDTAAHRWAAFRGILWFSGLFHGCTGQLAYVLLPGTDDPHISVLPKGLQLRQTLQLLIVKCRPLYFCHPASVTAVFKSPLCLNNILIYSNSLLAIAS